MHQLPVWRAFAGSVKNDTIQTVHLFVPVRYASLLQWSHRFSRPFVICSFALKLP